MFPLLIFAFTLSLTLSFFVLFWLVRPPQEQTAAQRYLQRLLDSSASIHANVTGHELLSNQRGTFAWLEEMLEGTHLLRYIQLQLLQSQSNSKAGTVLATCIALGIGTLFAFAAFTSAVFISFAAAIAVALIPIFLLRWKRKRLVHAFESVLPDCIDTCARSLRAGHSLTGAIGILAEEAPEPARGEFAEAFRKQSYGLPLRDALMQMLERIPSRDLQVVVTGIMVQKDTGGNLIDIMERIAAMTRERMRIHREVRTYTAQGRMTGWILCLLPPVLLLLINLMSPGYSRALFQDANGRKLLYAGLVLLAMGAFTIRKIVRGVEV